MNAVVCEMLYDLGGEPRLQPSVFPVVAIILRKVVQEEGDAVLTKAQAWQENVKLKLEDFKGAYEPSFENPNADNIGLMARQRFGAIICQDENRNCSMPFDA
jgi:hypothetical protein